MRKVAKGMLYFVGYLLVVIFLGSWAMAGCMSLAGGSYRVVDGKLKEVSWTESENGLPCQATYRINSYVFARTPEKIYLLNIHRFCQWGPTVDVSIETVVSPSKEDEESLVEMTMSPKFQVAVSDDGFTTNYTPETLKQNAGVESRARSLLSNALRHYRETRIKLTKKGAVKRLVAE